jgi:uncharacterized protein (TIGR03546 family)
VLESTAHPTTKANSKKEWKPLMLDMLAKLLRALNAEGSPTQISLGFAAGLIVGLTPLWSLHNLLLVFLVFLLRINLSAFFLAFAVFSGIAYLTDPVMDTIGEALLTAPALAGFWTYLYNHDIWRLAHFNNTLTLGSLASATVIAVPLVFVSNVLVKKYRAHFLAWIRKTKLMQFLKASRFYRIYDALAGGD